MEKFDPVKYINTPNWQESRLGLERIRKLLELLGNPQKQLKFVHVAGTNGKGSTVTYISQILIESGYKTGQFTSPYVYEFAERIRINNTQISDDSLNDVTLQVREAANKFDEGDHPTEFELITAVAFLYFAEQNCDVVISEVGMGGRLDSTNAIEAPETLASVITTIDMDHMQFLGDTIKAIATEKAGIIKSGVPVISATQKPDAERVILEKAKELNCKTTFVDESQLSINPVDLNAELPLRNFEYRNQDFQTQLLATYQPQNAALAIETCNVLAEELPKINAVSIKLAIKDSRWPARFDIISKNPYVILDGGHNVQGVNVLLDSLQDIFPNKSFIFIMGVLADKDYTQMVDAVVPFAKKVYTITPPNPRHLTAQDLAAEFSDKGIEAQPVENAQAIKTAKSSADLQDVIVAFGSLYSINTL